MHIGPFALTNRLMVAPMAGVTDRPFRQLCKQWGAGYAVSEMITSRRDLWHTAKTTRRADHRGESGPIAVQIAGTDPQMMADAARHNIDNGAQIIDINMGCPAKKVCNKWAGSALMQDEALALRIVDAVVTASASRGVPVTLKMRTGWCQSEKNAVVLARAAEQAGVAMITVHGRTREQGYKGEAEYDTVAAVKVASNSSGGTGRSQAPPPKVSSATTLPRVDSAATITVMAPHVTSNPHRIVASSLERAPQQTAHFPGGHRTGRVRRPTEHTHHRIHAKRPTTFEVSDTVFQTVPAMLLTSQNEIRRSIPSW